jgi:hypothetical protein
MRKNDVALWAGVAAFFGSLLAIGTFDVLDPAKAVEYAGALIVAFITAGGVYAKQRLDDAKAARQYGGSIRIHNDSKGKKTFSLELEGDPEKLEDKDEVLFKVRQEQAER